MFEVIEAGGMASLQDSGRLGWRRFGVPRSGPMDAFAFEAANLLAGNSPDAAGLEIGAGDLLLQAAGDSVIAVTGAGYQLSINHWDFPLWGSYFVRGGWSVRLTRGGFGMWAYIAVAGGLDVLPVLSSRSTYLRGRFGGLNGRSLQPGDILRIWRPPHNLMESAARSLAGDSIPAYGESPIIDVIPGPQSDRFTERERSTFFSTPWRVRAESDRMGYRLEGPPLIGRGQPDLTSEGMTTGSIQVPADGQPIAMMADCATTGGYRKIACITSASAPLLAQCTPGQDTVRFRQTTIESAQESFRAMFSRLHTSIIQPEE
jgi:antagonist of KipI